jgi:hypothetical protein
MDAVKPLNYAPKLPTSRRAWRWAYRITLLAAIIIAVIQWGPTMWQRAQSIYWEQQCLAYLLPPDHVVFEVNQGKFIHSEYCTPMLRFMRTRIDPTMPPAVPIFVHGMRRPDGTRRLVILLVMPDPIGNDGFKFSYYAWDVSLSPQFANWNDLMRETIHGSLQQHWKFFAGQPDLNNPSHFTFDYELDGHRHTYDAWLNNEGQLIVSPRP